MDTTTIGQALINDILPTDLRDHTRVLDKKGLRELLRQVATRYPDQYRDVSHKLLKLGQDSAAQNGGYSYGIRHLRKSPAAQAIQQKMQAEVQAVLSNPEAEKDPEKREKLILGAISRAYETQSDAVYKEALKAGNPLALQVASGARGTKGNLSRLLGSDLAYTDNADRTVPLPITSSYSEGLPPDQYWASTYGSRRGIIGTKLETAGAGYISKQLNQVAHRLIVTDTDQAQPSPTRRGLPVETADPDNEGELLAAPTAGYTRNTVLTPRVLADLKRQKKSRILIRSPLVGGPTDGGVYARDVGMREFNRLPSRGEFVGMTAGAALSEPLSQSVIGSKHGAGVLGSGAAVTGLDYIDQLINPPKIFPGGATHAQLDGSVQSVGEAAAGGQEVRIDGQDHYVPYDRKVLVRRGQRVEAGDVLSEGLPNPAEIVQHKGIGEGRRYFTHVLRQAYRDSGMTAHRRNVSLLARGLIDHVRLTQEAGNYVEGDVVPYHLLEQSYEPRQDSRKVKPKQAIGHYLEQPYLHYSIGTKVRPSVAKELEEFEVPEVQVHHEPPPFQPEFVRAVSSLKHDPDWLTQMYGAELQKSLLKSVHRGAMSDAQGTSFVPALVHGKDFGLKGLTAGQPPSATSQTVKLL